MYQQLLAAFFGTVIFCN